MTNADIIRQMDNEELADFMLATVITALGVLGLHLDEEVADEFYDTNLRYLELSESQYLPQ